MVALATAARTAMQAWQGPTTRYGKAMPDPSMPRPVSARAEPAMLERVRRIGWGLLALALLAGLAGRTLPGDNAIWWFAAAGAAGIGGILAVINVALVRSLYAQIDSTPPPAD